MDSSAKFGCKCGQSYSSNSSLYNHIKLKHDNDMSMKSAILKMGRPIGVKNEATPKKIVKKVSFSCKCGVKLASRGALSNHWRLVHKFCEDFKPDIHFKGRKKTCLSSGEQQDPLIKENDEIQPKQEVSDQTSSDIQNEQNNEVNSLVQHKALHEEFDQTLVKIKVEEQSQKPLPLQQKSSFNQQSNMHSTYKPIIPKQIIPVQNKNYNPSQNLQYNSNTHPNNGQNNNYNHSNINNNYSDRNNISPYQFYNQNYPHPPPAPPPPYYSQSHSLLAYLQQNSQMNYQNPQQLYQNYCLPQQNTPYSQYQQQMMQYFMESQMYQQLCKSEYTQQQIQNIKQN